MLISEIIKELQLTMEKYGDLPVVQDKSGISDYEEVDYFDTMGLVTGPGTYGRLRVSHFVSGSEAKTATHLEISMH